MEPLDFLKECTLSFLLDVQLNQTMDLLSLFAIQKPKVFGSLVARSKLLGDSRTSMAVQTRSWSALPA
jgi:hypothetical protein